MLQRTNKILIGKDIDRDTTHVADGVSIITATATADALASGEILVLDKNKKVLTAGYTALDTDTIYICQGTGDTYSYTDEAGTTVTGIRKVVVSDPIQGKLVKKYIGKSYTAKAERTAVCNLTGLAPVVGTEYLIRITYHDMVEHPGQFTQTYRHTATTTGLKLLVDTFTAKINAHKGRRVVCSDDDSSITLTGLAIPECTTGLTDLNVFDMVNFTVKFLYVNSTGNWATMLSTSTTVTYTGPTFGSGNWEQIRDLELDTLGYQGITNRTHWPVILPTPATVVSSCYDLIVIEHDKSYLSPDNQYIKQAPLTTLIAIATASTGINAGNQTMNVLDRLNPWMESFGFDSISL
jgi:hypothetical protein